MAITRMFDSPATAIIPKEASSQIKTNTTAICLNGLGKLVTSQIKTRKMRRFQMVISKPLNLRRII